MKEQKAIVIALLCLIPTIIIISYLWTIPEIQLWSYHINRIHVILMIYMVYCLVTFSAIVIENLRISKKRKNTDLAVNHSGGN